MLTRLVVMIISQCIKIPTELLCCTPETNDTSQLHFKNKSANKETHVKKDQICGYQRWRVGGDGIR